ncbi:hypothetical protein KZ483_27925 [Paenibacillus sp. sptzw28]|uniref:hypothetical protein n=1 Tax=Paenibacillus sp. sptzw28 TaxID=715179 RepID=UPI001C6E5A6D|nr:hypothetical protein [Paenibacillus sp. sptzw28]QYR21447.1 hypothetical protein KZ483_27925 [Paenibacillus sp. sptzw28]
MSQSEDKVIEEKKRGEKASWELPETTANSSPSEAADDQVPTNYENTLPSYNDPAGFEVKRTPGRLG